MRARAKQVIYFLLSLLCWIYLAVLFTWLALYLLTGEGIVYVALINYLAVYLFIPLVFVFLVALHYKRLSLWVGLAIGVVAFAWYWGALFVPRLYIPRTTGTPLTVMTFNVLAWHNYRDPILETIRAENPDIVFIQELNTRIAEALKIEMSQVYPYQILDPVDNPEGIGVISKYPIQSKEESLPSHWVGGPQVMTIRWENKNVTLVNVHLRSTAGISPISQVQEDFRLREEQARLLTDLVERSGSTILSGDANTTSLSTAYHLLTARLKDSWREAGFGLGSTFPGSTIPGSDRPRLGRGFVPAWLYRIDYVFHTGDWVAISAHLARIDGVSDHRGVVAVLKLRR